MQNSKFKMQNAKFKMQNAECKMENAKLLSTLYSLLTKKVAP